MVDPSALEVEYAADADIGKDLETEQQDPEAPVTDDVNAPSPVFVNADVVVDDKVVISVAERKTSEEIDDDVQKDIIVEATTPVDPTVAVEASIAATDDVAGIDPQVTAEASTPPVVEFPSKPAGYSAGKGLKGLRKAKATSPSKEKEPASSQWTTSVEVSSPVGDVPTPSLSEEVSVTAKSEETVEEPKLSPSAKETPTTLSRSSSNRSTGSGSLSRKGSSRDRTSRPISQVLQNKLLFDDKIANQFKRKEQSPEGSHRSSNSSLNSTSSRRSGSLRSLSEKPVSGTVAGARSMFESKKPPAKPPKAAWSAKLESDVPAATSAAVPETKPLETQPEAPTTTTAPKKKKRFPFKKKKTTAAVTTSATTDPPKEAPSTEGGVELLAVKASVEPPVVGYEERAIDVPAAQDPVPVFDSQPLQDPSTTVDPSIFSVEPPTKEKKKKKPGLISRITHRRSRKSSGGDTAGSDVESPPQPQQQPATQLTIQKPTSPTVSELSYVNIDESTPEVEAPSASVPEESTKPIVVDAARLEPPTAAVTIVSSDDESKSETKPPASLDLLAEIDTSLALTPDKSASTVLVSGNDDDIPPPSPAQASLEVKSVLESIIDRKPIDISASSTTSLNNDENNADSSIMKKKKKLVLKKKTKPKKDTTEAALAAAAAAPIVVDDEIVVVIPGMEDAATTKQEADPVIIIDASDDKPALSVSASTPTAVEEDVIIEEIRPDEPVVMVVQHDEVEENDIEESVSVKVDVDISKQDWPEELISAVDPEAALADNNNIIEEKPVTAETVSDPSIPQISIQVSSPDIKSADPDQSKVSGQEKDQPAVAAPFLDVDLQNKDDDDTISINSTTEKKKKKRFKFPLRKSSSKKHKQQQQQQQLQDNPPSPTKDVDIWETPVDGEGGKLEKKHSSKKLKRPKSLDFLGEIIHPTHKHKNEKSQQQRPVSMAASHDHVADSPAGSPQKSPTKHRRSFNLFKKKKHHNHEQVDGDAHPSPMSGTEDADVFKIPDVVDATPDVVGGGEVVGDNGHVSVSLTVAGQSDHS